MRKLNTFGAVLVAALALVAMMASSADANGRLVLKNEGTPVAKGGPAYAGFFSEECLVRSGGTVTANEKTKDKASFTSSESEGCFDAASISGSMTSAELTTAGVASFKANITVTLPDSCAYSIKKFTGFFDPNGGEVFMKA